MRRRQKPSVSETQQQTEQSAAADEGEEDTALLTLRPHQTCSSLIKHTDNQHQTCTLLTLIKRAALTLINPPRRRKHIRPESKRRRARIARIAHL